jgi:acyl-coenzyme A synthetase/AMP-(fatty) acid ligase
MFDGGLIVSRDSDLELDITASFIDIPAEKHPDRIAIISESVPVTYRELRELTSRAANALRGLGCLSGDRILIALPDSLEFVAAFFATAKVEGTAVPVSPFCLAAEYDSYLVESGATIAIVHALAFPQIQHRASELGVILIVVGTLHPPDGFLGWDDCVKTASPLFAKSGLKPSNPIFLLYTSGSTGKPKAAIHQYKSLLATSDSIARQVLNIGAGDITFSISKSHFAYGLGNSICFPLFCGASTFLYSRKPNIREIFD